MLFEQISLFNEKFNDSDSLVNSQNFFEKKFPKTRYQGSKYKLLPWIKDAVETLSFDTVLDAFGGTGSVSFLFKQMGKTVYYNDILKFNSFIGKALIENSSEQLSDDDISTLLSPKEGYVYSNIIESMFSDIYYTDEENKWLDIVVQNILLLKSEYKQSLAFWSLFQSCIAKRPYNLFHRKNLYVRMSDVKRSFGNKKTWDKPFDLHFLKFIKEANQAIFDNGRANQVFCQDALELDVSPDLVYIDPPYIPSSGTLTLYRDFYHFLEGMVDYDTWEKRVDMESKHRKLSSIASPWESKQEILGAFERLLTKFRSSQIVISYRFDGIPSIDDLKRILLNFDKKIRILEMNYKYVLSTKNDSKEVLLIAE